MRHPWIIAVLALAGCEGPTAVECADSQRFDAYDDADGDGAGDPATRQSVCDLADGLVTNDGDCDDGNPSLSPFEPELCDGLDNDCDSAPDDGLFGGTWFADADGDGFGDPGAPVQACAQPAGSVVDATDCDDTHADAFPGAPEVCDGYDNDCDLAADDDDDGVDRSTGTFFYPDADADGYGDESRPLQACTNPNPAQLIDVPGDCDDTRSTINPGAAEVCNEQDDNCDTLVDEDDPAIDPASLDTFYVDADDDGIGDSYAPFEACNLPATGYSTVDGDCDDSNALITGPSLWVHDGDGDGWGAGPPISAVPSCSAPSPDAAPQPPTSDCDDSNPDRYPTNPEVCDDGVDQDCTGTDAPCTQPSCEDYLIASPGLPSGVYSVQPTVGGPVYSVYCDMTTDGGGWTLVMSSGGGTPPSDGSGPYHNDLTTLSPAAPHINAWDGMKPAIDPMHDIRFTCKQAAAGALIVDLSFHNVDWYDLITAGNEAASCFHTGGVALSPERRNNLTGTLLAAGNTYNSGSFEGEDSCSDSGDFTVDFDDRGMDSNQSDGTDWGSDDSSAKCGLSGVGNSWFIWVR